MSRICDNEPPKLSAIQIDLIAINLIKKYIPDAALNPQPIPVSLLAEKYLGMEIDYGYLSSDKSILGALSFSDGLINVFDEKRQNECCMKINRGTILLDCSLLTSDGRERFTVGHEIGHWILHKGICDTMFRCGSSPRKLTTNEDWIEWQADMFSSCLLMPKYPFIIAVNEAKRKLKSFHGFTCNDEMDACIKLIAEQMAEAFNVSLQSASIRIQKLKLL